MIKLHKGTSIIEIVIAASLISIAVIAALSLSNNSQKQNIYARDLAEATKYASEASDWLRTERNDLGWATISSKIDSDGSPSTYCLNSLPSRSSNEDFTNLVPSSCPEEDYLLNTTYQRELEIETTDLNTGIIRAKIIVSWIDQTPRQASIELELTQW